MCSCMLFITRHPLQAARTSRVWLQPVPGIGRIVAADPVRCDVLCGARDLLAHTPDNYHYHEGLRAAMHLAPDAHGARTPQQRAALTALYDALAEQYPRSSAAQRIPLDFKASRPVIGTHK